MDSESSQQSRTFGTPRMVLSSKPRAPTDKPDALVKLYATPEKRLELTIANADARELVQHLEAGEPTAQAAIFAGYIDRLKARGCAAVALTPMGATVEVISLPADELRAAHAHYIAMAVAGRATHEQRAFFEKAATQLINVHGAKAVVLGGTDLFLAFDKPDYPYRVVDCAQVHAEAIARVGLA